MSRSILRKIKMTTSKNDNIEKLGKSKMTTSILNRIKMTTMILRKIKTTASKNDKLEHKEDQNWLLQKMTTSKNEEDQKMTTSSLKDTNWLLGTSKIRKNKKIFLKIWLHRKMTLSKNDYIDHKKPVPGSSPFIIPISDFLKKGTFLFS